MATDMQNGQMCIMAIDIQNGHINNCHRHTELSETCKMIRDMHACIMVIDIKA